MARLRKARNDRIHVIYAITNIVTNEQYIGLTVATGGVKRALHVRMQKHLERARNELKSWGLCANLRSYGTECFEYGALLTVRGKRAAHAIETGLIHSHCPALNTASKRNEYEIDM